MGSTLHAEFSSHLMAGFDFGAFAVEFEANDADLIGDAGLADVGDDFEFLAELPDAPAR